MVNKPISMSIVEKRKNYRLDTREKTNVSGLYESARQSIVYDYPNSEIKEAVLRYFKACSSKSNIECNYEMCLSLLEGLCDRGKDDLLGELAKYFNEFVIPYIPDMAKFSTDLGKYKINDTNTEMMKESAKEYTLCDRVLNNHEKISKRFKLDSLFEKKCIDLEDITFLVCEMVDTYTMKPHAKMEIVIEEMIYQCDRFDVKYNEQKLVESVTDYFLSREENTFEDINFHYKRILEKCEFISESACDKVKYVTEGEGSSIDDNPLSILESTSSESEIQSLMNKYKMEEEKSDSKMRQVLNKIFTKDPALVVDDLPDIFKWVRNFGVLLATAVSVPAGLVSLILNSFLKSNLEKDRMKKVIKYFEAEKDKAEDKLYSYSSESKQKQIQNYVDALENAIERLKNYENTLYTDEYNSEREFEDDDEYTTESMNKIVLNNLISDSQEAAEFIVTIGDKILHDQKAKKTEVKDAIDESSYFKYITENGRFDMVLVSYDITNVKDKYKLSESLDTIVSTVNNMIYNKSGRVVLSFGESAVDLRFVSKCKIVTSLAEETVINNAITDSDKMRICSIMEAADNLSKLEESSITKVREAMLSNRVYKLDRSQLETVFEAWSLYGVPIEESDMMLGFSRWGSMMYDCGEYVTEDEMARKAQSFANDFNKNATVTEQLEGIEIMNQVLLTEKFDLNSLKLAMMSFKKKAKDFDAKQKEMSRDMDIAFNHFIKSLKSAYSVDHREQIIRGQVNPSLSKIIKIGIGLAVVGVASNSIVLPAIGALGMLAQSKHMSTKEKKLILDEIDIELKVLDREIKKVEDSGKSTKKYRTLLTYQKNLQNERARILYGLKRSGRLTSVPKMKGEDN